MLRVAAKMKQMKIVTIEITMKLLLSDLQFFEFKKMMQSEGIGAVLTKVEGARVMMIMVQVLQFGCRDGDERIFCGVLEDEDEDERRRENFCNFLDVILLIVEE
ncbi:unnamed protein product [Vicia faba]|uniref:Uncharacterized protein n=1 Tax=Vicia faba TaxID=3906 RepID=A0AAV1BCF3_VICFA|nr:unnamed protein product [Vicia faba]